MLRIKDIYFRFDELRKNWEFLKNSPGTYSPNRIASVKKKVLSMQETLEKIGKNMPITKVEYGHFISIVPGLKGSTGANYSGSAEAKFIIEKTIFYCTHEKSEIEFLLNRDMPKEWEQPANFNFTQYFTGQAL